MVFPDVDDPLVVDRFNGDRSKGAKEA
jgi:hypothetical protein